MFKACKDIVERISGHYCRAGWIREKKDKKIVTCFLRPFEQLHCKGVVFSLCTTASCLQSVMCFHAALHEGNLHDDAGSGMSIDDNRVR